MKLYNKKDPEQHFKYRFDLRTTTWLEMIRALEECGLSIDSSYRRDPEKHVIAYDSEGDPWIVEVTQYFNGDYEVLSENIRPDVEFVSDHNSDSVDFEDDEFTESESDIVTIIKDVYDEFGEIDSAYAISEIEDRLDDIGIVLDADALGDIIVKSKPMLELFD